MNTDLAFLMVTHGLRLEPSPVDSRAAAHFFTPSGASFQLQFFLGGFCGIAGNIRDFLFKVFAAELRKRRHLGEEPALDEASPRLDVFVPGQIIQEPVLVLKI